MSTNELMQEESRKLQTTLDKKILKSNRPLGLRFAHLDLPAFNETQNVPQMQFRFLKI